MTGSLDSYLTFELSSIVLCSVFNQVSVWRLNHLIFSVAMNDHFCDVFITHKPHAAILDVEFRVWKLWLKSYSITTCTEYQKSSRTTTTSHRMWEWEPDCHWLCLFLIIQAHYFIVRLTTISSLFLPKQSINIFVPAACFCLSFEYHNKGYF